jgi:hypothetical protein
MTPEQFCHWLQGFIDLANPVELSPEEMKKVKDELAKVTSPKPPPYTFIPNVNTPAIYPLGGNQPVEYLPYTITTSYVGNDSAASMNEQLNKLIDEFEQIS